MSDSTVIDLNPRHGLGVETSGPSIQKSFIGVEYTNADSSNTGLLTPIDTPITPSLTFTSFKSDQPDRAKKRLKKRREKEGEEVEPEKTEVKERKRREDRKLREQRDDSKDILDSPLSSTEKVPRERAIHHDRDADLDRDREKRRRKKVLRQASAHATKPPDLVFSHTPIYQEIVSTPPPSGGLENVVKKRRTKTEGGSKSKSTRSAAPSPKVTTTSNYPHQSFPLTPITPEFCTETPPLPHSGVVQDDGDAHDGSVIIHRLDTTFSVRHVSDAGESTISSLPSEILLQGLGLDATNPLGDVALATSLRARPDLSSSLQPDDPHRRWRHGRDVSLVIRNPRTRDGRACSGAGILTPEPPTVQVSSSADNSGSTPLGPGTKNPLVLLHVNIMVPQAATYSDRALNAARAPPDVQANFHLLRDRLSEHVLMRGLLIAHPRNDYDLLEERILETLDLLPPSAGRVINGEFWSPEEIKSGTESDNAIFCSHNSINMDNDDDVVPCNQDKCSQSAMSHVPSEKVGGSYRWDVSVYAANGLMRTVAWEAAWREMESVDVEIAPWVSPELRSDLEHAQMLEDEAEQNHHARITDGTESSASNSNPNDDPDHGTAEARSSHQRTESEITLGEWASEGGNDPDTSATEVDSVSSGTSYSKSGKSKSDGNGKSKRKGKPHSVTFLDSEGRETGEHSGAYNADGDYQDSDRSYSHPFPPAQEPKPLGLLFRQYIAFKARDQRFHAILLGLFSVWIALLFTGTAGVGIGSQSVDIQSLPSVAVSAQSIASSPPTFIHPDLIPTRTATLTLVGTLTETFIQTETWSTTATVTQTATYFSVTTMTEVRTETEVEQLTQIQTSVSTVTETERYTTTHTRTKTQTHIHTQTERQSPTPRSYSRSHPAVSASGFDAHHDYHDYASTSGAAYMFDRHTMRGVCDVREMSCVGLSSCGPAGGPSGGRGRSSPVADESEMIESVTTIGMAF